MGIDFYKKIWNWVYGCFGYISFSANDEPGLEKVKSFWMWVFSSMAAALSANSWLYVLGDDFVWGQELQENAPCNMKALRARVRSPIGIGFVAFLQRRVWQWLNPASAMYCAWRRLEEDGIMIIVLL
jgi:hypothetical protein